MIKRKTLLILAGISAIALTAFFYTQKNARSTQKTEPSASQGIEQNGSAKKSVLTVSTTTPLIKNVQTTLDLAGPLQVWQESLIAAQLPNQTIDSIFVDVGDVVKKGQVLAQLNAQSILIEKKQLQAQIMEAKALLRQAQENAQRAKALEGTEALSTSQITQIQTAYESATARSLSLEAQMEQLQLKLSYAQVRSPATGIISERTATVGSLTNSAPIFRLMVDGALQWQPTVSSDALPLIAQAKNVELLLPNGKYISTPMGRIAPKVNEKTRQATLLINIPSKAHPDLLKPGMFLKGRLVLPATPKMLLPKDAVVLIDGKHYVFSAMDGKAQQKEVTTSGRYQEFIMIDQGVDRSDRIITLGAAFLKNNDPITVVADPLHSSRLKNEHTTSQETQTDQTVTHDRGSAR